MSTPLGTRADEEYTLPSAEALLGGTLALMTGLSQTSCAKHRALMEQKIVANLDSLTQSPQLSAGFRQLLESLRLRWQAMHDNVTMPGSAAAEPLWHRAPATIQ
ncbi:MAG: hypothetical protein E6Q78_03605 [Rhodoferax sp.]|nr:MAG: hypothetical protein E6Q78_03605 [Rhodoferax sp.]